VAGRVTDVDNIKRTRMLLLRGNDTNATTVATTSNHHKVAGFELHKVDNLLRLKVEADRVIDGNFGVGVAESATVMSAAVRNALKANPNADNLAKLVLGLGGGNAVKEETALHVVEKAEALVGLLDGDDIHEACRVGVVSAGNTINLHGLLGKNHLSLTAREGVLQPIAENENKGNTVARLVGTSRGLRGPLTTHLRKHPVLGCGETLKMLLRSEVICDTKLRKQLTNRGCKLPSYRTKVTI